MICGRCEREIDKYEEEYAEVYVRFCFPHKDSEDDYLRLCEKCIEKFMEFMRGGEGNG